ncbi:MAG TPA: 3-deoxy-manno-octulosonate cytidylyltransferase [Bacteroidales bacterium]|nr:MAG: 3-deoxy-manno-octulosonate cytidylyltransferase [Bacteroidetes bacterium ADurb.Bin037]HPV87835.1 3-deoxy-manno-octulosonate cytidylyltransferase [Bacteroidales bacterium]HPW78471.1 3-deoxy-manno-octulosonate cytidylyltransferase [Bacteroidales bacterium]HQB55901.1 3-deoxy-manno-octulosonate cytidylyltransferase [Bacteroidales bacterium]
MYTIALIPARYASTRFPGKLMQKLGDKSVILHTYQATLNTGLFKQVVVVTDSQEIFREIVSHGGEARMSLKEHLCGSDRIAEAALYYPQADVIVNVQGDEPFTSAGSLKALLGAFEDPGSLPPDVASLMSPINDPEELNNPNVVKVVTDRQGFALLFSRSPIPYSRDPEEYKAKAFRHIGIYAFRREALLRFASIPPGPLELSEKLENMRFLENNMKVKMIEVPSYAKGIDVPEDLEKARKMIGS